MEEYGVQRANFYAIIVIIIWCVGVALLCHSTNCISRPVCHAWICSQ